MSLLIPEINNVMSTQSMNNGVKPSELIKKGSLATINNKLSDLNG